MEFELRGCLSYQLLGIGTSMRSVGVSVPYQFQHTLAGSEGVCLEHLVGLGWSGGLGLGPNWVHGSVVGSCVVLRVIIGHILFSRLPKYMKLALSDSVPHPIKTHVDCSGSFLFGGAVEDAFGCRIVGCYGCLWLGIFQFDCGSMELGAFLAIVEQASHFSFHGTRYKDISHDAVFYVDRAVEVRHMRDWLVGFGAEEEISSISAAGFRFGQI
eukprot:scaffold13447_cov59-Attheya_sp.AAC.8